MTEPAGNKTGAIQTPMTRRLIFVMPILLAVLALGARFITIIDQPNLTIANVTLLKMVMTAALHEGETVNDESIPEVDNPATGFQARALAYLASIYGEPATAEKWLAEGLLDQPSADLTQFSLCLLYWNIGQRDLALDVCRGTQASAQYWIQRGYTEDVRGNHDEALAYYQMAAYIDPGKAEAWRQLGHGLLGKGYYDQAVVAFERVLAIDPLPTADVYGALGSAYLKLGNTAMTRDVLNRGLLAFDDQRAYYLTMADSYRTDGDNNAADSWYARLLQRWPNDAQAWAARGEIALASGRYEEALEYFQTATTYRPEGVGYWINLALASAAAGELSVATDAYQKAMVLRPEDATLWLQAGRFFVEVGKIDEAKEVFARVLVLQPENEEAAADLAAITTGLINP